MTVSAHLFGKLRVAPTNCLHEILFILRFGSNDSADMKMFGLFASTRNIVRSVNARAIRSLGFGSGHTMNLIIYSAKSLR